MVSTKFKPGQKVKYESQYLINGFSLGVVVPSAIAEEKDRHHGDARTVVWAYWNGNSSPTFMDESLVIADGPPPFTRNLPDWF